MPKGSSDLFGSPIAFRPEFAKITGNVKAALVLSQCYYRTKRSSERDGWFCKKAVEWEEETALSRRELEHACALLSDRGFLETRRAGKAGALNFRANVEAIEKAVTGIPVLTKPQNIEPEIQQNVETEDPCFDKSAKHVSTKPQNTFLQNVETLTCEEDAFKRREEREERSADALHPLARSRIPSLEQCERYFKALGRPDLAEEYFDAYAGRGWVTFGKNPVPVEDYQAEARKWVRNAQKFEAERSEKNGKVTAEDRVKAKYAEWGAEAEAKARK